MTATSLRDWDDVDWNYIEESPNSSYHKAVMTQAKSVLKRHNFQTLLHHMNSRIILFDLACNEYVSPDTPMTTWAVLRTAFRCPCIEKLIELRIIPIDNKPDIQAKESNEWISLQTYLTKLPMDITLEHIWPDLLYIFQRRWWSDNDKSFPFLFLPGELRNLVYRHASASFVYRQDTSPLLRTCKQIRQEVLSLRNYGRLRYHLDERKDSLGSLPADGTTTEAGQLLHMNGIALSAGDRGGQIVRVMS